MEKGQRPMKRQMKLEELEEERERHTVMLSGIS
jgi:hypothetical protein